MKRISFFLLLLPSLCFGQIFKCVVSGRVIYSDSPCVSGGQYIPPVPEDLREKPFIFSADSKISSVSIPLSSGGSYFVNGTINGRSVLMQVDTGASFTSIPASVYSTLGLPCYGSNIIGTANGILSMCHVHVRSLNFAGFQFSNVDVMVMPNGTNILLGNNILSMLTLRQSGGVMTLSK